MSHGPATGAVIDGAVESLRCRHMSLGSEYMNGPAPRVTLGISGENNWSHRHYHTTRRNVWLTSLANFLSAQSCVVWRQFKSNHRLPPALFAYTYCIVYMIVAMCLCMVRCVVIQWSRKCGCSCCQFRKLQIVTVVVSINFEKPDLKSVYKNIMSEETKIWVQAGELKTASILFYALWYL